MNNNNQLAVASMVRFLAEIALASLFAVAFTMSSYCMMTKSNPMSLIPHIGLLRERGATSVHYNTLGIAWDNVHGGGHLEDMVDSMAPNTAATTHGLIDLYVISNRDQLWTCQMNHDWVYIQNSHEFMYCNRTAAVDGTQHAQWIYWNANAKDAHLIARASAFAQEWFDMQHMGADAHKEDVAGFRRINVLATAAVIND